MIKRESNSDDDTNGQESGQVPPRHGLPKLLNEDIDARNGHFLKEQQVHGLTEFVCVRCGAVRPSQGAFRDLGCSKQRNQGRAIQPAETDSEDRDYGREVQ